MAMITVDDYLDAFKEMCDYDEIDAKHFGSESLEAIIPLLSFGCLFHQGQKSSELTFEFW